MSDVPRVRYGLCDASCGWGAAHRHATEAPQSTAAAVQPATGTPTTPSTDDTAEDD